MRWQGGRESDNVEDGRRVGGGTILGGGIGAVVIGVIIYLMGGDPSQIMNQLSQQQDGGGATQQEIAAQEPAVKFVKVVMGYTEDVWTKVLPEQANMEYKKPILHLFSGSTKSECGNASAATGPFYCPADEKVYIDLTFYDELKNRFHAPGDFAMAYVIAHEVGHHIQHLLGISDKVHALQQRGSQQQANALSVKLELQADFLAGVWANHAQKMMSILDPGDVDDALRAANAIGDDNLQKEAQGYVVPESFTHGTSAQRIYWFKKGFDTGDMNQGDTFGSSN